MSKLRCGQLTYTNALPLYGGFLSGAIDADVTWQLGTPTKLNQLLKEEKLDFTLASSFHYLIHQEELEFFPEVCIAASNRVDSVSLYVKEELDTLDGKEVALTEESATSVQLLKVLCKKFWGVVPHYTPLKQLEKACSYPAFLLIGDQALKHPHFFGYKTIDLASIWHEKTALPLPFALFVAPKKTLAHRRSEMLTLMEQIKDSYQWGKRNEGKILEMAAKHSSLSQKELTHYYSHLHYEMGRQELAGLKAFATLSDLPHHALL